MLLIAIMIAIFPGMHCSFSVINFVYVASATERFHSRGQQLCKRIGTKESLYIRKEFNSHRIGLGHQHGRRFMTLLSFWGTDMAAMTSGENAL